jgi:stress responsive alpha/beta barrel protein
MWKRLLMLGAVVAVIISVAALTVYLSQENRAMAADQKRGGGPELAHMVFFTLKETSDANREKMVRACKDYLSGHDGVVYFSVGTRNEALEREVNDKEYDVALHLVFKDKAAHDTYQEHARHKKFISDTQSLWSKVRVFDSDVR